MPYGESVPTSKNNPSGYNYIDAWIYYERWKYPSSLTFSFPDSFRSDYESDYLDGAAHASSFTTLYKTERIAVRSWLKMYESVSGLKFTELAGQADRNATIRVGKSNDPFTGYAYYPGENFEGGDVWINVGYNERPVVGNYDFHGWGHELGHALGLKHGHESDGLRGVSIHPNVDSVEFSIMSYRSYVGKKIDGAYSNEPFGYSQSLMMYDIRAIQQMYGANFNYESSNTIYSFSPFTGQMFINGIGQARPGDNRIFRTIWDGNGIDIYDFSNYATNTKVNLAPGKWSDLDVHGISQRAYLGDGEYARGHVFNAFQFEEDKRSLIEGAYGGSGNDWLLGNSTKNFLRGNAGNDYLVGNAGNDSILGGSGNDSILGGSGNDYLNGTGLSEQGAGERDLIKSGSWYDQDVFVLGQSHGNTKYVFYKTHGNTDYSFIYDAVLGEFKDKVQLAGNSKWYSISDVTVKGSTGAGIYFQGNDLICVLDGVNASSLSLSDLNQFTYV